MDKRNKNAIYIFENNSSYSARNIIVSNKFIYTNIFLIEIRTCIS